MPAYMNENTTFQFSQIYASDRAHVSVSRDLAVGYATGSRGNIVNEPVTRQQRKAAFAFTLCLLA